MRGHVLSLVLGTGLTLASAGQAVVAQTFPLAVEDVSDPAAMARSLPALAEAVLAAYGDTDRVRFLGNAYRLQMLTGRYAEALASLEELRAATGDARPKDRAAHVQYEIFSRARLLERGGRDFEDAFEEAFRDAFGDLDDAAAAWAARSILVSARSAATDLRWATPNLRGRSSVSLDEALVLLHVYAAVDAYRAFSGLPPSLVAEDEARRYRVDDRVRVRAPDGATLCALVVRPRGATDPLPSLLQFTIYADSVARMREAVLSAGYGYVGVIGYTRGKVCSPDSTVPYVHDGPDATAVIEWIAEQPWSDGRVGMYGGSYSGFTAWAAAKRRPRALRAILVGAPVGPGIDVPMEGNIFWNFVYPWPFYTTNNRFLDNEANNDGARWAALNREWYTSGRPYRSLPAIDGEPNPIFEEWIAHPAVDEYWTSMIPQGEEYAELGIPVLQTAGYFFGGPGAAAYYFLEHTRNDPDADHTLLIGPYDHFQGQGGVVTALGDTATFFAGYETDPAAWIDIVADVRFPWFDHVLRGGERPSLLADRVNYQVMGANRWAHAPAIEAMADERLRLYLNAEPSEGPRYTLSDAPGAEGSSISLTVDLADRSDVDRRFFGGLMATVIDTANAIVLVSEPLVGPTEVSGLLSGHLEVVVNKRDFDFRVTPYELTADGRYYQLAPFQSRASYVESLGERRLLTPGRTETLDFASRLRMISRQLGAGSRVVVVLGVVKGAGQQINYGTGGDVSDESIDDAGEPLTIHWLPGSFIELPIRR